MTEAQIPVMILTPFKETMSLDRSKTREHGAWAPYAFPSIDFEIAYEAMMDNQYYQFRRWLI